MNNFSGLILRRMIRCQKSYGHIRKVGSVTEQDEKKLNPRHFLLLVFFSFLSDSIIRYVPLRRLVLVTGKSNGDVGNLIFLKRSIQFCPLLQSLCQKSFFFYFAFNWFSFRARASTDLPEFQPVVVTGRFDHAREVIVGPRAIITDEIPALAYGSAWGSKPTPDHPQKQSNLSDFGAPTPNGYCIITPFELTDRPGYVSTWFHYLQSTYILVNRGFVPTMRRDPKTRPDGQIKGEVTISGYIRYNEKVHFFPLFRPSTLASSIHPWS